MQTDTLTTIDGRHVLRMQRRLAHQPRKVWRAITEPGQMRHWFPAAVTIDDSRIAYSFDGTDGGTGEVTARDEPALFEYTWDGSVLRWELRPDGEGCMLVFTHIFDDLPGAASFAAGWDACITALRALLAGAPAPMQDRLVSEHEAYVRRFGLDRGVIEHTADGWQVRFERQLTGPADTAWAAAGVPTAAGTPVPGGLSVDGGTVTEVEAPKRIEFDVPQGHVRWELTEGTGHGARLVVTHTGAEADPIAVEAAWRDRVERLAAKLAEVG